jgi:purine-nucleoside phosphorylase
MKNINIKKIKENFLYKETADLLLKKFKLIPDIAIITGSGVKILGEFSPSFEIKYNDLPIWSNKKKHKTSPLKVCLSSKNVKGHESLIKLYSVDNKKVLVFSGRRHLYEGLPFSSVITNVRLCYEIGIKRLLITNAAGGISSKLDKSDLMLITGFLNLMQPTERGLLDGIVQQPVKIKSGLTDSIKKMLGKKIKTGIYAATTGPTYETFSEIIMLNKLGASAVGMSTIPEIICAKSLGIDFAAISIISNIWSKTHKPSHKEVLNSVNKANKKLNDLFIRVLSKL